MLPTAILMAPIAEAHRRPIIPISIRATRAVPGLRTPAEPSKERCRMIFEAPVHACIHTIYQLSSIVTFKLTYNSFF